MKPQTGQRKLWVCLLLAVLTAVCYSPLASNQFINLDDPVYIVNNPNVNSGLSWSGVLWALQTGDAANWHPLTWISHMTDCSLFGLNPGLHHLMSLLFHVLNVLLLFALLTRMTGAFRRSAFAAAFFAWHPVHVESVAWASERKDVLSTFFFLLTLLAYVRYAELLRVEAPATSSPSTHHASRFTFHPPNWRSLALLLFALGLMSKPMLVTLPFVLLLLDFWPLGRLGATRGQCLMFDVRRLAPLLREKVPFFALSIASSVATFLVQHRGGAISTFGHIPLPFRVGNALLAYVRYLWMTFWPTNLAPMYVLPDNLPRLAVIGAALFLAAVTVLLLLQARRRPYLITGWCWYLGTLVPTIGLVQVGPQAMADRYLYIPGMGLFLLVVWGLADLLAGLANMTLPHPRRTGPFNWSNRLNVLNSSAIPVALATPALTACLALTWVQAERWHDAVRLYQYARQTTGPNYIICDYLGVALAQAGRQDEALTSLSESVRLAPTHAEGQYNLGTTLLNKGRLEEAVDHLKVAVHLSSDNGNSHHNLGNAYLRLGRFQQAITELAEAAALKPDDPAVRLELGSALMEQGRLEEGVMLLSDALRMAPNNVEAHRNLGVALARQGKFQEASRRFAEAVGLDPKNPELRFQLGLSLLDLGQPEEAAAQFAAGLLQNPNDAKSHYRLAVALSRQHKTEEAIPHFREALRLHPDFPEAQSELALALASDTDRRE